MAIFAPVFIFVWTGSFLSEFLHSGILPGYILLLYCVSCLLFLGVGSSGRWWGGGPFLGVLLVSSGGFPEWDASVI